MDILDILINISILAIVAGFIYNVYKIVIPIKRTQHNVLTNGFQVEGRIVDIKVPDELDEDENLLAVYIHYKDIDGVARRGIIVDDVEECSKLQVGQYVQIKYHPSDYQYVMLIPDTYTSYTDE